MHSDDALARATSLWTKWKPNEVQADLWRRGLRGFSQEVAVRAVEIHFTKSRYTYPIMADVLKEARFLNAEEHRRMGGKPEREPTQEEIEMGKAEAEDKRQKKAWWESRTLAQRRECLETFAELLDPDKPGKFWRKTYGEWAVKAGRGELKYHTSIWAPVHYAMTGKVERDSWGQWLLEEHQAAIL